MPICVIGEMCLFAQHGSLLPKDYEAAEGQLLPITGYTTLFGVLGTTYGGNGTSTFALPSVQSLAPNHMTYAICISGTYP